MWGVLVSNVISRFPLFLKETLQGAYSSCALTSRIDTNQLKPVGNGHAEHIYSCLFYLIVLNDSPNCATLLEQYNLRNSPTLPTLVLPSKLLCISHKNDECPSSTNKFQIKDRTKIASNSSQSGFFRTPIQFTIRIYDGSLTMSVASKSTYFSATTKCNHCRAYSVI
jgi:hypothetical protein